MIEFPIALADDLLNYARVYLKSFKSRKNTTKTRKIESLCQQIELDLGSQNASEKNPTGNNLGALCFQLNSFIPIFDLKRAIIVFKKGCESSFAESLTIAVGTGRYFDKLVLVLHNKGVFEDLKDSFIALSRLSGVGHFILHAQELDSTCIFEAIQTVPIRHLEIRDVSFDENPDSKEKSFIRELAKYLAANPPLEKLSVYGHVVPDRSPSINIQTRVQHLMKDYNKKNDTRSEQEKYEEFLAAVEEQGQETRGSRSGDDVEIDHLSVLLSSLLSNYQLKVCFPASLQNVLNLQAMTLGFPVGIVPESVRLIAKKFALEEIRFDSFWVRNDSRLCDHAFANFFASKSGIRKLSFNFLKHIADEIIEFIKASEFVTATPIPLTNLDDYYSCCVSIQRIITLYLRIRATKLSRKLLPEEAMLRIYAYSMQVR